MAQETYMLQSSALNSHLDVFHSENTLHLSQNGTVTITVPKIGDSCIHQVFSQRVRESPDSEAVCGWDQQFSYSELDTLSSRLAFRLVSLNVGSEVLVPLCFEKSAWTIVAMMAVLKAGGAFVPLDPSYPVKRLQQIIRQTGANLILTSPQYIDLCRPLIRIVLPVSSSMIDELPALSDAASFSSQPSSAAYVIFTSGSTGQPKGVVIEHRAFCACAVAHGPAHRIESTSRVLQFASYSFDASLVEILTTLMSGGCCCVPSATDRVNDLARAMHELRVDLAILTPTVAALLAPKAIPLLKTLVMVGETMQKSQIQDWGGIPHLLCAYGPTEASVSATVNSRVTEAAGPTNLGVPVGCHVWITDPDDHNRLLPRGEIGEALIEGPNLARGYLNDPERTRNAFIDNTSWQKPGQRFYKTGDLMRRNDDGTLNFFGRKDMQIKIRGQRVEVGEIEQCLAGEDGVSKTAVVWPNSGPYARRLVGVVCLETLSNKMVDTKDLRLLRGAELVKAKDHLSSLMARAEVSLPSFMVPAVILPVEVIPLLLSGKVDRSKITEWIGGLDDATLFDIQTRQGDRDRPTARMKLELTISQIWAEVLNIPSDQMNPDNSFLFYGGDSVSAIQVVSKCRAKGIKITVQDILKWKTVSRLLPHVVVSIKFDPIREELIEKPFKLSPIQQMFFDASPNGENHFNQSFLLRAKRVIKPGEMQRTLEAVVKRHSMLRARFVIDEKGSWLQRITNEVSGSYRFQCHKSTSFDAILPVLNSRQESLDIVNGPVFVCDLFYTKQLCFISVIAHHVVADLVSWRIIFDDIEQSLASGDGLPDVPMSFQNWCILQAEYSQEHLTPGVAYPFAVEPTDLEFWKMDNELNLHGDTREEVFELDEELTNSLLKGDDCHRILRTEPMDLFLSALLYSFREEFPERGTPSIHVEGHGREVWDSNIDISQTVGWFTTLCPLHIPIGDKDTIIDVVRFTKDLRRAIPHKGWGYFASRYLNPEGRKTLAIDGPMELVFNYSGLYQQLERPDCLLEQVESSMQESSAQSMTRFSLFEVNAYVEQGCLQFSFKFNRRMAHQERIQKWTVSVKQCLKDLAEKIRQLPVQYTLSDFPKARLTYDSLDNLAERVSSHPGMTPNIEIEDIYPCAPMQQGILISQAKGSASYKTHTMWEVESSPGSQRVDMERLENAWRQVISRHPCLRTIFVENITANESFHQVVLRNVEGKAARRQWDSKSLELHHPYGELNGQAQIPVQFTIYEAENGRVFSSLNISHLVMDGLSIDNIVRDILLAYDDRLPPAPVSSYGDYISILRDQTDTNSLQFWKVRLADLEPCFFPRLEVSSEVKREQQSMRSIFSPGEAKKLLEFCEKENFTISTLFQLAWAIVLQSYVGTDDVCFGYLVSGRDVLLSGIEDLVGAFSNMLICRADLSKMNSVSSALESMQTDVLMSLEHEFCSLGEVHNALGVPALFNTIMSYQRHEVSKVAVKSSIEFEKIGEYDPSEVRGQYTLAAMN
jgi:amino acid adenylation domain-containing protein/non-ribosomal peptide synthase protein (TIGR01720 family)